MGAHTLTASQKLERVKISRKLVGQLNKHRVNDLTHVIMRDKTWVYFENLRPEILIGADVRRQTRPKQLIVAKKVKFWVCFTPIGMVDMTMCRQEKRSIGLFSWTLFRQFEKETGSKYRSESRKGPLLHLNNAKLHLANHEIQANDLIRLSYPAYSSDLTRPTSCFLGI
jgi:hypothetical protein